MVYNVVDTKQAVITGVNPSQTKEYNSTLKLRSNVKAYTVDNKNLTKNIVIKVRYPRGKSERVYRDSTIKLNKLGTYRFFYYVTNPNNGLETKVTAKVLVKDTKKPKLTGVVKKKTLEYNAVRNLKSGVKAKLVSGKNVTSKIVVKVRVPRSKKYVKLSEQKLKKYKFNKTGTYRVQYSITNPYNKKAVAKQETVITVKDTKKPKISGVVSKKTMEYNSTLNLKSKVTAELVSGKSMTAKIVIKVKVPEAQKFKTLEENEYKKYRFDKTGIYTVEYSVANPNNKKAVAVKNMLVVVKDTKAPVISGVKNIEVSQGANLDLMAGVKATLKSGTDVTEQMQITVTAPGEEAVSWTEEEYVFDKLGSYKVVYTVVNPISGKQAKKTMIVTVTNDDLPFVTPDDGQEVLAEP